jgi:hypothetical protein
MYPMKTARGYAWQTRKTNRNSIGI